MNRDETPEIPLVLDPETLAALDEGIAAAEQDHRRWTAEEVKADAKRMTREWRKNLDRPASA
jgi:hypothetical protein